ncbi:class I SAM-dependent methyltransferase [Alkalimarinus alittae]|uniref:Class I SAM-dependent methyltransferase n=1 Tax=Alkalimarinus alittae TaxID=2961619 RepID=A0ABY6MZE3_9ALTE|nr:class I SAM-dependent methyltransferase [Alkalimarinus alittae]UZE95155.1 class I SAM-dependent methyltransferase [Alkalimarinus alittae]
MSGTVINLINRVAGYIKPVFRGNHTGWYASASLGKHIDPLARFFEYLLGVSIPRQKINRIKPQVISDLRGDIIEIGGFDNHFRSRYNSGEFRNLDVAPGKYVDIVANAECIPEVKSNSLGGIICISVIEHTTSPHKIIEEAHRCLKPGGVLLLSSPWIFETHMEPNDFLRFSKHQLENWCDQFETIEVDYTNSYVGVIAHFLQRNVVLRFILGSFFCLADLTMPNNSKWATQITLILKKR